jgi:hypothetical protein
MSAELHPALTAVRGLVGTWQGEGDGHYPTIAPFRYREEVTFGHDGRPVLRYAQTTRRFDEDVPMHVEVGYLRLPAAGTAELVIAQPTGFAEVATLTVRTEDTALVLDGTRAVLAHTPSAKDVLDVRRRFVLDGDTLTYDLWMTYAGHVDTHHLRSTLQRR